MIKALFLLARPKQWLKNTFVGAAVIFAGRFTELPVLAKTATLFIIYCLLSSAIYSFNDVLDREADRLHPAKKNRPVANGDLSPRVATVFGFVLFVGGLSLAAAMGTFVFVPALIFAGINLTYQKIWKKIVILDVMAIASGFLVRAWAGALGINVPASPWFLLLTGLLALFLGFAKRRYELVSLKSKPADHRLVLAEYSLPYLDQIINSLLAAIIITYSLWAFNFNKRANPHYLMLTVPVVIYVLYRYLHLIYQPNGGDSPENMILSDPPLLISIGIWTVASGFIIKFFYLY